MPGEERSWLLKYRPNVTAAKEPKKGDLSSACYKADNECTTCYTFLQAVREDQACFGR